MTDVAPSGGYSPTGWFGLNGSAGAFPDIAKGTGSPVLDAMIAGFQSGAPQNGAPPSPSPNSPSAAPFDANADAGAYANLPSAQQAAFWSGNPQGAPAAPANAAPLAPAMASAPPMANQAQPQLVSPQAGAPINNGAQPMGLPPVPQWSGPTGAAAGLDTFFTHGRFRAQADDQYARQLQAYSVALQRAQFQRAASYVDQTVTDPQQRAVAMADPVGYVSKIEEATGQRMLPYTLKQGEERGQGQGGGPADYNPLFDTSSGRFVAPGGPTGMMASAGVGGDVKVDPTTGAVVSSRTGVAGFVPVPQKVAPGESLDAYNGAGAGAGGMSPVGVPGQMGLAPIPGQNATPPLGTTRGDRNLNPTNLKPPSGPQFNGTAGVDPNGYLKFDSVQSGIRAADLNLQSYAKQGVNTPQAIAQRWAPNAPPSYAAGIASAAGVAPDQPVDLTNPAVRQKVLQGIIAGEGTMRGVGGASGAQPGAVAPQGGSGAPTITPLVQGRGYSAPQTVMGSDGKPLPGQYVIAPDGKPTHIDGTGMTPSDALSMGKSVRDDKSYTEAQESNAAYSAMINLAQQPQGGMRAYALRDTFARTINPGAVARAGTIEAIKNSQGVPENIKAYFMNLKGDGDVPPKIVQQILDAAQPFAASHWQEANALNQRYAAVAQRNGLDPDLATAPLSDKPKRFSMSVGKALPDQGDVVKGYRFLGGDPSKPQSWVKAQ